MIVDGPLSEARQRASRRNFNTFNFINGFSYMCLGEMVIILLAIRLDFPNAVIGALGAMLYFGYFLLPLGKFLTARLGAARSQAAFWVMRNCAALLVAASAVFAIWVNRPLAMAALLCGAFFFYGFRAAGVVMAQPLYGEITDDRNRAAFLAASAGLFYCSCLVALAAISLVLRWSAELWVLPCIIVVGATFGFTSSRYLVKVDETTKIRDSARRPIRGDLRRALGDQTLRRQILAGFAVNLGVILLVPMTTAALKRGYGVSDTDAMLFGLVQFSASAVLSFLSGKVAESIGPRRTILLGYLLLLSIGVWWVAAPVHFHWYWMIVPFICAGASTVGMSNSMTHYFLQTVEVDHRVASSMFIAMVNGTGAGAIGMALAALLLHFTTGADEAESLVQSLAGFRQYFLIATLLLLPGIWLIGRLKPLPMELRRIQRSWSVENS